MGVPQGSDYILFPEFLRNLQSYASILLILLIGLLMLRCFLSNRENQYVIHHALNFFSCINSLIDQRNQKIK